VQSIFARPYFIFMTHEKLSPISELNS